VRCVLLIALLLSNVTARSLDCCSAKIVCIPLMHFSFQHLARRLEIFANSCRSLVASNDAAVEESSFSFLLAIVDSDSSFTMLRVNPGLDLRKFLLE
jgi:hypothetical protein